MSEVSNTPSVPYYEDEWVTLYHGDCMEILPSLEPVDLIVTDPPYFQPASHYVQPRGENSPRAHGDTSVLLHAFRFWAQAFETALSRRGTAYVFCDGQDVTPNPAPRIRAVRRAQAHERAGSHSLGRLRHPRNPGAGVAWYPGYEGDWTEDEELKLA